MVVINSDNASNETLMLLRQQFNATVNSVQNAWRVPVIKIGKEDTLNWTNIDSGGRDMEFQYLFDSNIRIILSAFNMSPEELPGYNHLSKGTNNQSLSESNNEYKLEAARDVGIRPLLSGMENFMNTHILPLFDKEVAQYFKIKFYGLDSETPEREATRLEKEQQLWSTFNDTLRSVDKEEIPKHLGGDMPLAMAYSQILDKYVPVGAILEHFFGLKGAEKDPRFDYIRDQFYFQKQAEITQMQMAQQQQQMAQQQMAQQPQKPNEGDKGDKKPESNDSKNELESGIEQALQTMSKSEKKRKK